MCAEVSVALEGDVTEFYSTVESKGFSWKCVLYGGGKFFLYGNKTSDLAKYKFLARYKSCRG